MEITYDIQKWCVYSFNYLVCKTLKPPVHLLISDWVTFLKIRGIGKSHERNMLGLSIMAPL